MKRWNAAEIAAVALVCLAGASVLVHGPVANPAAALDQVTPAHLEALRAEVLRAQQATFGEFRKGQNEKIRELTRRVAALEKKIGGGEQPPGTVQPWGIGPYAAPGGWGGGLDRWLSESERFSAGQIRLIPLASAWMDGLSHPFLRTASGKFDLTKLDPTWAANFRAGLERARAAGITVTVDLFDEVSLKSGERQARHPFNGANNLHPSAPRPGEAWTTWEGIDPTDAGRTRDFPNQIEHAMKADWPGANVGEFHLVLKAWVGSMVELCRGFEGTVVLCPGNELESRSVEAVIFGWLDEFGWTGKRELNGSYLWNLRETGAQLLADSAKRDLFARAHLLRIHHCKLSTIPELVGNLAPVLAANPHLGLVGDSDGAGFGPTRGQGGRPTLAEEAAAMRLFFQTAGEKAAGWLSKGTDEADHVAVLAALKEAA
jgi:hypothetical protein